MTQPPNPPYESGPQPGPGSFRPAGAGNDTQMAMLAHILGIVTSIIGPLILWVVSKDDPNKAFSTDQAKEALNFQITVAIGYLISGVLSFVLIGLILLPLIGIAALVFGILAALAANRGERYRYPFTLRLVQ
ncbi:DUF4870 domain-containing protein [uncultured Tessaracoccus sp.]|mgnify:CR=1 FL=1|uniref:DUF4870 domain-containing protein n=1 Tax=uncultured Tessaracoccus sp. TaxID=905023 RepID=UPI0025FA593D|nr:DUF4870 domain-containing protein [uncultured Tessaracoccus sp.]